MAEPSNKGFLSGYAGNGLQRVLRWGADRILPGNQRAQDGTLTNVGSGLAGLGLKLGATAVGGPVLGQLVGRAYGNYQDTGSIMPSGSGPLANLLGYGDKIGPVTKQQIGFPSNEGGAYQMARPAMNVPTMPTVQAETPWTGSLAGRNPFGGTYGGNLGFSAPQQRAYGSAAGSFTPYGAGAVQVAGQGWAGSDAAAGFGLGAQGAGSSSGGSIALSDAIALHRKFAR